MKPPERRSPSRHVAASAEDGLDEQIWELLRGFMAAVGRGDASGARSAIPRLEHDLPNDGQAAAYIWYVLRYRVVEILGRKPASEDLHELATSTWPALAAIVHGDAQLVEDVLRSVFKHAPAQDDITGAKLIVLGSVTLAVLLDDPSRDLEVIRPHLAEWWRRNLESFRSQGIIGASLF